MRLLLLALLALPLAAAGPRHTFITKSVSPDEVVAEPIYTPMLDLRPENSVARSIKSGEVLNCDLGVAVKTVTENGVPSDIRTILLDCDGARFSITGLEFQ